MAIVEPNDEKNWILKCLLSAGLTLWMLGLTATSLKAEPATIRTIIVVIPCVITVLYAIKFSLFHALMRFVAARWLLTIICFVIFFWCWLLYYPAAAGIYITPTEILYGFMVCYALLFLLFAQPASPPVMPGTGTKIILITLISIVLILAGVEVSLRYTWIRSDNFQFSKIHQTWVRLYWNPINEVGYRDVPIAPADDGRQHIIVLGDSFVSGYGINKIQNTFPHQLNNLLGDEYTVNIVAQPGWGIYTALHFAQQYPLAPDVVILSHYINDIVEGLAVQGHNREFPYMRLAPPPGITAYLVEHSYLADFLFYRVFLYTQHDALRLYNDWIQSAYQNPTVMTAYEQEMQAIIDWTEMHDIPLIVLVWANLADIPGSAVFTNPVISYFESQNIPIVDTAQFLADDPLTSVIVSPFDSHPSADAHQQAANALFDAIQTLP